MDNEELAQRVLYKRLEDVSLYALVIEDNPGHVALIVDALKESGISNNILCVESGLEAIRYLRGMGKYKDKNKYPKPNLIVLDLKLPGIGGKEILRHMKSDDKIGGIPVIVLTSSTCDRDLEECYKLGASGFITKPIRPEELAEIARAIPSYWITVSPPQRSDERAAEKN